eukprot:72063-Chlamydomonas_euryale.AAC.1
MLLCGGLVACASTPPVYILVHASMQGSHAWPASTLAGWLLGHQRRQQANLDMGRRHPCMAGRHAYTATARCCAALLHAQPPLTPRVSAWCTRARCSDNTM